MPHGSMAGAPRCALSHPPRAAQQGPPTLPHARARLWQCCLPQRHAGCCWCLRWSHWLHHDSWLPWEGHSRLHHRQEEEELPPRPVVKRACCWQDLDLAGLKKRWSAAHVAAIVLLQAASLLLPPQCLPLNHPGLDQLLESALPVRVRCGMSLCALQRGLVCNGMTSA